MVFVDVFSEAQYRMWETVKIVITITNGSLDNLGEGSICDVDDDDSKDRESADAGNDDDDLFLEKPSEKRKKN